MPDLTFEDVAPAKGSAPQAQAAGNPGDVTFEDLHPQKAGPTINTADHFAAQGGGNIPIIGNHTKGWGPDETPMEKPYNNPNTAGNILKSGTQSGLGNIGDIREKIISSLPESVQEYARSAFRHLPMVGQAITHSPTTEQIAGATGHGQTQAEGLWPSMAQGAVSMATNPLSQLGAAGFVPKVIAAGAGGAGAAAGNETGIPGAGVVGGALGGSLGAGVANAGETALKRATAGAAPGPIPAIPGVPKVNMGNMPTYQATTGNVKGAYGATPIAANPALKPPPVPMGAPPPAPGGIEGFLKTMMNPHTSLPMALGGIAGHHLGSYVGMPGYGAALGTAGGAAAAPYLTAGAKAAKPYLNLGAATRGGLLGSQLGQ